METKNKIILAIFFLTILSVISFVFALSNQIRQELSNSCEKKIEFYYHPSCPHCQEVYPLVKEYEKIFTQWKFYYFDISKGNYNVSGVPTIKIYPDNREIILIGSEEVKKYFKCELQEKSTLECPTHLNLVRDSYFIKEWADD